MSPNAESGWYFEDFSKGQGITSPARTVTEVDVVQFAGLSGDYNPLHTDAEFASGTPYGRRIAHGLLGLSITSGLAARTGCLEGTVQAFTGLEWKFKQPIYLGDTVHVAGEVKQTRAIPSMGGGIVILSISLINQDDEVVQQGEWKLIVKSGESDPA